MNNEFEKNMEGSDRDVIECTIPVFYPEELVKTAKIQSELMVTGQIFEPGTTEHNAGILTT